MQWKIGSMMAKKDSDCFWKNKKCKNLNHFLFFDWEILEAFFEADIDVHFDSERRIKLKKAFLKCDIQKVQTFKIGI